jgi:hypothetical protein
MKTYTKPETTVVKIQQQSMICQSPNEVTQISSLDLIFGGGAAADARTREQSMLGEEW